MIPAPALSTPLSLLYTLLLSLPSSISTFTLVLLQHTIPPLLYDGLLFRQQHHQCQLDCKSLWWLSRCAVICIHSPVVSTLFICVFWAFFPPAWSPALRISPLILTSAPSLLLLALVKMNAFAVGGTWNPPMHTLSRCGGDIPLSFTVVHLWNKRTGEKLYHCLSSVCDVFVAFKKSMFNFYDIMTNEHTI